MKTEIITLTLSSQYKELNPRRHSPRQPVNSTIDSPYGMYDLRTIELVQSSYYDHHADKNYVTVSKEHSCCKIRGIGSEHFGTWKIFQTNEEISCQAGLISLHPDYQGLGLIILNPVILNHPAGILEFELSFVNDTQGTVSLYLNSPILNFIKLS